MNRETVNRYIVPALIIAIIIALDVVTKHYVLLHFSGGERYDLFGGFVRIALVYNEGGVFGILQGYKNLFLVISIIVLVLMIAYYIMEKNKTWLFSLAMALIMAGAVGNIIDRLITDRPGVVDFISVGVDGVYRWPSFNVADSSIVVGAIALIIVFFRDELKRKKTSES